MRLFIVHFLFFLLKSQFVLFTYCSNNITKAFRGVGRSFERVAVQRVEIGLGYTKTSLKGQVEGSHFYEKQRLLLAKIMIKRYLHLCFGKTELP